jgi:ATP-dependent protease HslVU (ClpYQ) peptidase subunit
MTTIVGIQGDGFAVICTDSRIAVVDENGTANPVTTLGYGMSKIAQNGPYLIGAAGDVRAINILHHAFTPPTPPVNLRGKRLDAFMTVKFIPALRECLEKQGYSYFDKESNFTAGFQSTIITVINSTIYVIDGDYSWASDSQGLYAIGSGSAYALGALHVLAPKRKPIVSTSKTMAIKAISAAAKYDPGTGAPYQTFVQEQPAKTVKPIEKKPAARKRVK